MSEEKIDDGSSVQSVVINGLNYEVDRTELEYLMKFDEDQRLATLISMRYEFHILEAKGQKRVETIDRIKSRAAIRFASEFVKYGMRK